jgi:broad specificity phosphatase PhoE
VIVHFVRHGQTAHNRDGLGLGRSDEPLTELGQQQAAAAGARLAAVHLDHVYSSPLGRALTTAVAVAGERGLPVQPDPDLIELDVGETEGLTFPVMRERYPDFLREWGGPEGHLARMPGGERLLDVSERLDAFLPRLLANGGTSVAVVSHNFVIKLAVVKLLGLEIGAFRNVSADVASITTMQLRDDGHATLRSLNDRCHLHHLEP